MTHPMLDANTAALADHEREYSRRDRIGERAEEIARDKIAEKMGDAEAVEEAMSQINGAYRLLVEALGRNPTDHPNAELNRRLAGYFAGVVRAAAIDEAEQEEMGL